MSFHLSNKALSILSDAGNQGALSNHFEMTYDKAHWISGVLTRNLKSVPDKPAEKPVFGSEIYVIGLINEIFHQLFIEFEKNIYPELTQHLWTYLRQGKIKSTFTEIISHYLTEFPTVELQNYQGGVQKFISDKETDPGFQKWILQQIIFQWVENDNKAYQPYQVLFSIDNYRGNPQYRKLFDDIVKFFSHTPEIGNTGLNLLEVFQKPGRVAPDSINGQLKWIRDNLGDFLGSMMLKILRGLDFLGEDLKFRGTGPGYVPVISFSGQDIEAYSEDLDWMSNVIIIAKNIYVWLVQLSRKYQQIFDKISDIPDIELDMLSESGFNSLWLIGIWERSAASKKIKRLSGNPDAEASAYALFDYVAAESLGGSEALEDLDRRCRIRGIRLACDMVPNHTGIDSKWSREHPDWFIQSPKSPFTSYSFTGDNLSTAENIQIQIEDHYFDRTDAAVVFKRTDNRTGEIRYIYHGNDGTSMPWNDTAQLNYLIPDVREAVILKILQLARQFDIIRFDAAMTLAKRHFHRLWFPAPGSGSDIPSRSVHGLSDREFNAVFPVEFWREVVDRIAEEAPETLLLAEAFWMMEGYFVRTLGMHRVYNSAFMNMLKNEDNAGYRQSIKNILEYDPEILKRFVNFLNNPDEEPAAVQFGKGDKYFGVTMLMITMPGTPMFGHGQIDGFSEKYGMEYSKPYFNEEPDKEFISHHQKIIFPVMKNRKLFSDSVNFRLYDFLTDDNTVDENVFAYSNRFLDESVIVFYNNFWQETHGIIHQSVPFNDKISQSMKSGCIIENLGIDKKLEFIILRNFHDNRKYLYRVSDIRSNGLYFRLSGYESTVFYLDGGMDDDENHNLSSLFDILHGKPFMDLKFELLSASGRTMQQNLIGYFSKYSKEGVFKKHNATLKEDSNRLIFDIAATLKIDIVEDQIKSVIDSWTTDPAGIIKSPAVDNDLTKSLKSEDLTHLMPYFIYLFTAHIDSQNIVNENDFRSIFDLHSSRFTPDAIAFPYPDANQIKLIYYIIHFLRINLHSGHRLSEFFKQEFIKEFLDVHEYKDTRWFSAEKLQIILNQFKIILTAGQLIKGLNFGKMRIHPGVFAGIAVIVNNIAVIANQSGYQWEKFLTIIKTNERTFENN